jgi:hypothetical protein
LNQSDELPPLGVDQLEELAKDLNALILVDFLVESAVVGGP